MNILGIDPAAKCGFAHSNGEHGVWILKEKSKEHPGLRLERFRRRLFLMRRDYGVDAIGIEDAGFGAINDNTAAMHNELIGIAKLVASEWSKVPVFLYKPCHLKKWLTGNGRADKSQMIAAVNSQFGLKVTDDNVADAICVMERTRLEVSQGALK